MALSLGLLYESIVSKVQNGKWFSDISIKTTAHWNSSPIDFSVWILVNSLDKGFRDETDFLENHAYEHNISPLCWQQFETTNY